VTDYTEFCTQGASFRRLTTPPRIFLLRETKYLLNFHKKELLGGTHRSHDLECALASMGFSITSTFFEVNLAFFQYSLALGCNM